MRDMVQQRRKEEISRITKINNKIRENQLNVREKSFERISKQINITMLNRRNKSQGKSSDLVSDDLAKPFNLEPNPFYVELLK